MFPNYPTFTFLYSIMPIKKVLWILLGIFVFGILVFSFIIYATIKVKSKDISKLEPFQEWVGKTVPLHQEVVVFKELISLNEDRNYPYIILDKAHPKWQYVEQQKTMAEPDLKKIDIFPVGSTFQIEKATIFTNGVSGFSTPYVFGTIRYGDKEFKVGYQWGEESISKRMDNNDKSWKFHQAPWQSEVDTIDYALPEAKGW